MVPKGDIDTSPLIRLKLQGGRFDAASAGGHAGFPLEAMDELVRYQRLLVAVARQLWKAQHEGRKRVPKGFAQAVQLSLTNVEEGSVVPGLELMEAPGEARLFKDYEQLVTRSHGTITQALGAVVRKDEALPSTFPQEALSRLVRFGSGLHENESIVFKNGGELAVKYDQGARRHLVDITSEELDVDGERFGRVFGIDAQQQSFEFLDRTGVSVHGTFAGRGLFPEIKEVTEPQNLAPFVRLTCRYRVKASGALAGIDDVEDVESVIAASDPLGDQLRELYALEDGWHDGDGAAIATAALEWTRDFVAELDEDEYRELNAFPTVEGGISLVWQVGVRRWSLEAEPSGEVLIVEIDGAGAGSPTIREDLDVTAAAEHFRKFLP